MYNYIVWYCIVFSMYWKAPRLALVATWVIQILRNIYIYILYCRSFRFISRSNHCYWERNECLNIKIGKRLN